MGRIVIEEYGDTGSSANDSVPIAKLNTLVKTTDDATTSTSSESVVLSDYTKVVKVFAAQDHRIAVEDNLGTVYSFIAAGVREDYGVTPGSTIYYRSDA